MELTPESSALVHFILDLPKITDAKFSNSSKAFLSHVVDHIFDAQTLLKKTKIEVKNLGDNLPKGSSYSYIVSDIRKEIENMDKNTYKTSFSIRDRKYKIYMVCENISQGEIRSRIHKIFLWLYVGTIYARETCSKETTIYLYFTDLKKVLPNPGTPIKELNANTAFTTSCKPSTEIYIYREEEWFKVLIHESFHNLGLDFSEVDHERSNQLIFDIFPVKSDVSLFETYCETWAEILNVLFIAYFENRDRETCVKTAIIMIQNERKFSLFQCAKVLGFYGLEYRELHERTPESVKKRNSRYKETTHVLSYYIIKSIFMFHANAFIEWCLRNNKESLQFQITDTNITAYCGLLKTLYAKPEYNESIQTLEKWISENLDHKTTMRMTLYEQ